jgi:protein-S-isoprenylcysteine O-methyltransferase Ste14
MAWGYLQYRWCGGYRRPRGGGGPGTEVPPDRLVTSGPYAIVRNPMYLGHLIFLTGLALTLRSPRAALLAAGVATWFHRRVLDDERRLHALFGDEYTAYTRRVSRWLPGLF